MKTYQWLTLSAAIVITVLEGMLFTSASSTVPPIETRTTLAVPEAHPATSLANEGTGRNSPGRSGEAP
jgi:hypothetical protein